MIISKIDKKFGFQNEIVDVFYKTAMETLFSHESHDEQPDVTTGRNGEENDRKWQEEDVCFCF